MTKDEALKLALEALVEVKSWKSPTRWDGCFNKEITAIKEVLSSCQCPKCKVVLHASDCAVHNEPAYPKDECNCGAQPEHGWTSERIAGMSRLKEAQDKKLAQPSVSVEKKLSSFQEEELMQQQVRDFMRSH